MKKISKREVVKLAVEGKSVPYSPWSFGFTQEPAEMLHKHYGTKDLDQFLHPHLYGIGGGNGFFTKIGKDCEKDIFGVVWDKSVDKDIGIVKGCVLPEPALKGHLFPDPENPVFWEGNDSLKSVNAQERYRVYNIGFSLYERAWTLRGMENLMMDFIDHPEFVKELLKRIADFNIELVRRAVKLDIDAVYFGDDWGQQIGLQMGPELWRQFIKPQLARMYGEVRGAGKKVFIHSCGDVDELFDELIEIGLNCFNPFQPEVMDVSALMDKYHGKLAFHGGLSTQKTLPRGTVEDVRAESNKLLKKGLRGGYIFSPAHAVEGDVPLENILAFIGAAVEQPGFKP
jgi:uroporphyrinogen decarboxylase